MEIQSMFEEQCKNNLLKEAQETWKRHNKDIKLNADSDYIFTTACSDGNLYLCQWLVSIPDCNIDLNADDGYPFTTACLNGHLHVAKWIYKFTDGNILSDINHVFTWSCSLGYLEVAKWLYDTFNVTSFNIAFVNSCASGELEVVQWLCSLPDTNVNKQIERALNRASINKQELVVNWLKANLFI